MFKIGGKKFSGNLSPSILKDIINEMKNLPEPELASNSLSIDPEEAVICLQKEAAYVDELDFPSKKKYIGSKNIHSCILVYLYSPNTQDHLVLHADNNGKLDLSALSKFNDITLEVILVGGDIDFRELSEETLEIVISALYEASKKFNINIKSQKVLERNKFIEDAKYQFIFDRILYKADIICRQYFNSPLNDKDYENLSVDDLRLKKNVNDQLILVKILAAAQEMYDPTTITSQQAIQFLPLAKNIYKDKETFINDFRKLFSIEGFKLMSSLYTDNPGNHLTNFVFDIKTKKIHVINECFKTPNEALRSMYASGEERKDYFLCYRLNQYLIPKLSEKQLARCKKVIAHVKNNQGSRQQVAAMFHTPITDAIYINRLVKNSREIATDFCTSLTNTSSFFQSREEWNRRYVDPNSDPVIKQALPLQSNLLNINEITGLRFEAKIRHEPAYTIDAYCEFKSLNEAKEVADNLQQHNIISHIISVGDKSNHTYHLCIPAINVRNYATAIAEAKYVKLR